METREDQEDGQQPEDHSEETGAKGGSGTDDAQSLPASPTEDESEAGDTDQHSSADA